MAEDPTTHSRRRKCTWRDDDDADVDIGVLLASDDEVVEEVLLSGASLNEHVTVFGLEMEKRRHAQKTNRSTKLGRHPTRGSFVRGHQLCGRGREKGVGGLRKDGVEGCVVSTDGIARR